MWHYLAYFMLDQVFFQCKNDNNGIIENEMSNKMSATNSSSTANQQSTYINLHTITFPAATLYPVYVLEIEVSSALNIFLKNNQISL